MIHRALVALVLLSCLSYAQAPDANSELNAGVQSYKNARYEEAIDHFKRATELDPTLLNARVYLATAYAMQYVPGADTEDNLHVAALAIEQYKKVLEADPQNVNSVKGIAYLNLNMKKFEEAKKWYNKASEIDPNDPEAFYSAGVIDWTQRIKHAWTFSQSLKSIRQTLNNSSTPRSAGEYATRIQPTWKMASSTSPRLSNFAPTTTTPWPT